MDSEKKLAKILKVARKKAKLTQAQVAVKAEIHTNYYARIERGEVNLLVMSLILKQKHSRLS